MRVRVIQMSDDPTYRYKVNYIGKFFDLTHEVEMGSNNVPDSTVVVESANFFQQYYGFNPLPYSHEVTVKETSKDYVEPTHSDELPDLLKQLLDLASKVSQTDSGLGTELHATYVGLSEATGKK